MDYYFIDEVLNGEVTNTLICRSLTEVNNKLNTLNNECITYKVYKVNEKEKVLLQTKKATSEYCYNIAENYKGQITIHIFENKKDAKIYFKNECKNTEVEYVLYRINLKNNKKENIKIKERRF